MDWTELRLPVAQIQEGNTAVWQELLEKLSPYVLSRTRYQLKSAADAEDAAQEVLLEIYKNLHTLSDPQALGGWVKTITLRTCYKYYKQPEEAIPLPENDEKQTIDYIDDRAAQPEASIATQETADTLRDMIDALPELQRQTMVLFYYDELKIREIAALMDCSENTVKSRLNYAKKSLEAEISEKRRKGIAFPAVVPWPLLLRQWIEKEAGALDTEKLIRRVLQEAPGPLGSAAGSAAAGGAKAAGLGLAGGVKLAIGIAAIVAVTVGGLLWSQNHSPTPDGVTATSEESGQTLALSQPVTDGDYARLYYQYIQDKWIDKADFVDAEMCYLHDSPIPLLLLSCHYDGTTGITFLMFRYQQETQTIESFSYTAGTSIFGFDETLRAQTMFLAEIDERLLIVDLLERQGGIPLSSQGESSEMVIASFNTAGMTAAGYDQDTASASNVQYYYYPDVADSPNSLGEIQALLSHRVGSFGVEFGSPIYLQFSPSEITGGERLRDYFDD